MVNKLSLDSAGDAQCVPAAAGVLAHQWLQVLKNDPGEKDAEEEEDVTTPPHQSSSLFFVSHVGALQRDENVSNSLENSGKRASFPGPALGFTLICRGGHTADRGRLRPGLSQSNYKSGHFSL